MADVKRLLALANGAALHDALDRRNAGVSYRTVARWIGAKPTAKPSAAMVPLILQAFGIAEGAPAEAGAPEWALMLRGQVERNEAMLLALQRHFGITDPEWDAATAEIHRRAAADAIARSAGEIEADLGLSPQARVEGRGGRKGGRAPRSPAARRGQRSSR